MIAPDLEYWMANDKPLEYIIAAAVGFPVDVYWGDGKFMGFGPGRYYQIMPLKDELGGTFWIWHLDNNPNDHWFRTPLEAGEAFVRAFQRYRTLMAAHPPAEI